eukprot:TRINITY_DN2628_c0_g1_i2.p2 TRINITY_DN2628_c0_g1~~TRINITY_DN2628_c0_g1_i2.p2  ORF type:complete len:103 (+),score=14.32 TRINITY_DN2628_c0_g1_i2:212-520(+)
MTIAPCLIIVHEYKRAILKVGTERLDLQLRIHLLNPALALFRTLVLTLFVPRLFLRQALLKGNLLVQFNPDLVQRCSRCRDFLGRRLIILEHFGVKGVLLLR